MKKQIYALRGTRSKVWKILGLGSALGFLFFLGMLPQKAEAYPQQGCKLNSGVSCIVIQGGSTNFTDQTKPLNPNSPLACTGAPICGRASNLPYFERGHRTPNVGSAISRDGYVVQYNGDGSFRRVVCAIPDRCGKDSPAATAAAAAALEAAVRDGTGPAELEATDPVGWLDSVTCDGAKGWAYDPSKNDEPITVHVYVDGKAGSNGKLLTSAQANQARDDVNSIFNLSNNHGFSILLPDSVRDGKTHTLYVYGIDLDGGTNLLLGGGGKSFNCTGTTGAVSTNPTAVTVSDKTAPVGWFDSASATAFKGWALDQDNATAVIDVHFYADATADKGGKLLGYTKTTEQRDDINSLYKTTGTHGFTASVVLATAASAGAGNVAGKVSIPLALQDGKAHHVYAYAIDSNGTKNPLTGGSPKSVVFGSAGGTGSGGEGGGRSNRHNDLSKCDGSELFTDEDPGIGAVIKNGKIELSYSPPKKGEPGTPKITVDGKEVALEGGKVIIDRPDQAKGGVVVITVNGQTYYVDTEGVAEGGTVSVLVPPPCVRIGYNDVGVGEKNSHSDECGKPGNDATCDDEEDGFLNIEGIQAAGLHVKSPNNDSAGQPDAPDQFELEFKVVGGVGGSTPANKWTPYDWRACGQYSAHCIRLKGKGILFGRTKVVATGGKFTAGHYSLASFKAYDIAPRQGQQQAQ